MTPAVVAPAVVTMIGLLLLAGLIAAVVLAGYTGKLERRFPSIADQLRVVARVMNGDEQVETSR